MILSCLITFSASGDQTLGFEEYPVPPGHFDFFYENPYGIGWQTTSPSSKLEIWGSGFMGIDAYEGVRFTELNTYSIYHDLLLPHEARSVSFAHRARVNADYVNLSVIDLAWMNVIATGDFLSFGDEWRVHELLLEENSGNLRVQFTPIPTGGSNSGGNHIDWVRLQNYVPSSASITILAAFILLSGRKRR